MRTANVGGGIVKEIFILGIATQKGHFAAGSNKRHSMVSSQSYQLAEEGTQ
jgi:hypothetical protein